MFNSSVASWSLLRRYCLGWWLCFHSDGTDCPVRVVQNRDDVRRCTNKHVHDRSKPLSQLHTRRTTRSRTRRARFATAEAAPPRSTSLWSSSSVSLLDESPLVVTLTTVSVVRNDAVGATFEGEAGSDVASLSSTPLSRIRSNVVLLNFFAARRAAAIATRLIPLATLPASSAERSCNRPVAARLCRRWCVRN